jgi:tyrosinase
MRTEITIDGADKAGANYIAWAPVHSNIRLVEADGGADVVDVVLQNQNPGQRGQIVFFDAIPGARQDRLRLRLPADGTSVDFFIAGKPGHPSVEDKDAVIEAVEADTEAVLSTKALMVRIRKNANNLTTEERNRFLSAFAILNNRGEGRFRDFRDMHTSDSQREAHFGPGFLSWHRAYLLDLERELQQIDPSVALLYWKFDEPAPKLFTTAFMGVPNDVGTLQFDPGNPLEFWKTDQEAGISRTPLFNANTSPASQPLRPPPRNEAATMGLGNRYIDFAPMEIDPHGAVHVCFRGFIQQIHTAARDPLFFLLHTNVDRLWAKWQWLNQRFDTTDPDTYPFLGSAGDPGSHQKAGHNLEDYMWPWCQDDCPDVGQPPRPPTAPGGTLAASPTATAPGPMPTVGDMIDYQGVISLGQRLGFGYDDYDLPPF